MDFSGIWKDLETTGIAVVIILAVSTGMFMGKVTYEQWWQAIVRILELLAAGGLLFANSKKKGD